jgi:hypothetical protein
MKRGNENKNNIIQRIINTTVKSPQKQKKIRSKSPVSKFTYELPKSFFEAVDEARVESGYDPLPRLHHLSVSPSSPTHETPSSSSDSKHHDRHHHHHQKRHKISRSSSISNKDKASTEKHRGHRKSRGHSHHHHKDAAQIPSPGSLLRLVVSNASRLLSNVATPS